MADGSTIEWTDATWNPLVGCSRVSPGCDHCYAVGVVHRGMSPQHRGLTIRRPGVPTDWTGEVRLVPHLLDQPLRWRKPRRIFVNSLSDLFHRDVPTDLIVQVFATMLLAPRHTFQVLTKRPQRMADLLNDPHFASEIEGTVEDREEHPAADFESFLNAEHRLVTGGPLFPNVWLGTSIESDGYAWRADHLRRTPAAVRFLSLEPLLGPLPSLDLTGIDWVVAGGESGHGARPMHPDWVRDIRDRCVAAGCAFFFKQWGEWAPALGTADASALQHHFHDQAMWRVGKKGAGRELDGRTWDEMPTAAA